jgi:hypothetical protein
MFCTKCGRELADTETYCPYCGQIFANLDGTPYFVPDDAMKDQMAGNVLTWGILSLAFSASGCLSLLGFIFSLTARKKAKEYTRLCGELEGRARVGNILGRIGFGVGIGYTAFWILYIAFFALIFGILGATGAL